MRGHNALNRRVFLSAVAAGWSVFATSRSSSAFGAESSLANVNPVDWKCDVIQTVGQPPRHRAPVVTGVSLQPQGQQLAIVGDDHFVSVYDLEAARFRENLQEHRDWVRVARFSPTGQQLVTSGNDRRILVWDSATWSRPTRLADLTHAVIDVAFSPDAQQLACVGFSQTLYVYDLRTGRLLWDAEAPCADMHSVCYSPDGLKLAAGGRSGTVRIWESATGKATADLTAHRQRIRAVRFVDNQRLLTGSEDQTICLTALDQVDAQFRLPRQSSKFFDVLVLDEDLFAMGGSDNRVHLYQLSTNQWLGSLQGHTGTVSCLAHDRGLLVSGSYDTQVRVWHRQQNTSAWNQQTQSDNGWKLK